MSNGNIVQCIGAVVDIKFPREAMPKVYEALTLDEADSGNAEAGLTFEVQQQLGDGIVRTTPSPSCCWTSSVSAVPASLSAS